MLRPPLAVLPPEPARRSSHDGSGLLVGVDGGATKTLAAAFDVAAGTVALGHAGPSNPDAVGTAAATAAVHEAVSEALDGITAAPDAAVLAVAGTDEETLRKNLASMGSHDWTVVNDVITAWAAATQCRPGIAAIAGTGSNVFGVGPKGTWRAGGWGHIIGDEGSAYAVGVRSINAVLADRDGSGPPTALTGLALAHFGVGTPEEIPPLVYGKPLTKGEIAGFARRTGEAAHDGDAVAIALYERAAADLVPQIVAVIRETGLTGDFMIGLVGSAYAAGAPFLDPLLAALGEHAPEARIERVSEPPVSGSLLLAARAAGMDVAQVAPAIARALAESPELAGH